MPTLVEAVTRTFAIGEAPKLQSLFDEAGFTDFETDTVRHTFVLPSFDAYYSPFERGGASTGQALAALPDEIRRVIREEVRRELGDTGGPREFLPNASTGRAGLAVVDRALDEIEQVRINGYGYDAIAKRLNRDRNHKIAFGHDGWHKRTVYQYLRNPQVMGWKLTGKMRGEPQPYGK